MKPLKFKHKVHTLFINLLKDKNPDYVGVIEFQFLVNPIYRLKISKDDGKRIQSVEKMYNQALGSKWVLYDWAKIANHWGWEHPALPRHYA